MCATASPSQAVLKLKHLLENHASTAETPEHIGLAAHQCHVQFKHAGEYAYLHKWPIDVWTQLLHLLERRANVVIDDLVAELFQLLTYRRDAQLFSDSLSGLLQAPVLHKLGTAPNKHSCVHQIPQCSNIHDLRRSR